MHADPTSCYWPGGVDNHTESIGDLYRGLVPSSGGTGPCRFLAYRPEKWVPLSAPNDVLFKEGASYLTPQTVFTFGSGALERS
jgi:hypothetical protein